MESIGLKCMCRDALTPFLAAVILSPFWRHVSLTRFRGLLAMALLDRRLRSGMDWAPLVLICMILPGGGASDKAIFCSEALQAEDSTGAPQAICGSECLFFGSEALQAEASTGAPQARDGVLWAKAHVPGCPYTFSGRSDFITFLATTSDRRGSLDHDFDGGVLACFEWRGAIFGNGRCLFWL